jgi:hypothetical protein
MPGTRFVAVATVAVALAAVGCGGSGNATLSGDELVARADAICNRAAAQRKSLPNIRTRADYGTVLGRASALQRVAVAELEKLKPPASLAADWKRVVDVDRTLSEYTATFGRDVSASDPRDARALLKAARSLQQSIAATTKRDGLEACGQLAS